ncbi:MAG: hypothetical protein IH988_09250 [Planctomycetes bacterium]|nr:hypothetical protein [Planctomycetota bacterium]
MLARYNIIRGKRPPSDPVPDGIRQDARWRTKHVLRPDEDMVQTYLDSPDDNAWRKFSKAYFALLDERYRNDQTPFDQLAQLANDNDVFIGCSCPTKANPRVDRCHTFLALDFMNGKYRTLSFELPQTCD